MSEFFEDQFSYALELDGKRTVIGAVTLRYTDPLEHPEQTVARVAERAAEQHWRNDWPDTNEPEQYYIWYQDRYLGFCSIFPMADFHCVESDDLPWSGMAPEFTRDK